MQKEHDFRCDVRCETRRAVIVISRNGREGKIGAMSDEPKFARTSVRFAAIHNFERLSPPKISRNGSYGSRARARARANKSGKGTENDATFDETRARARDRATVIGFPASINSRQTTSGICPRTNAFGNCLGQKFTLDFIVIVAFYLARARAGARSRPRGAYVSRFYRD